MPAFQKITSRFLKVCTVAICIGGTSAIIADDISLHTNLGDIATTGFSGIVKPSSTEKLPSYDDMVDETFINTAGTSAKIITLRKPEKIWQGQELTFDTPESKNNLEKIITAAEVGQVFGATFDSAKYPNLYLTATSSYGLNIVKSDICEKDLRDNEGKTYCAVVNPEDVDVRPERVQKGENHTRWMNGQWGAGGGPGTVWKVNGRTRNVSVFTNITHEGKPNAGAALGNITYDRNHHQMFVSDLDTGMIHRLGLNGKNLETYDHGVTGREALELSVIKNDADNRISIISDKFDSNDPSTWGFAAEKRQVWGMAVHKNRLYYSVWNGGNESSEIWSVDIKAQGHLGDDIRRDITLPINGNTNLAISDITFSKEGAMLLAERGNRLPSYNFEQFADTTKGHVYRYWLERPNDEDTDTRWVALPEEYAVGFDGNQRNTSGGIALGYGYDSEGNIEFDRCDETLWTSGENLRISANSVLQLDKTGQQNIDGLQASSSRPVKSSNNPPWASYFIDFDKQYNNQTQKGHIGDVAVSKRPCQFCRALPQEPIPFERKKDTSILVLGDAVTTGFSGVIKPASNEILPSYDTDIDETFINTAGVSAKVLSVGEPNDVWEGQQLSPEVVREITAAQVGQVFGITIDNSANIYLGATSLYGLNIVKSDICEVDILDKDKKSLCAEVNKEDKDTRPERLQRGDSQARWMKGQWGPGGEAGSIWRVNGRTGSVSLFANVRLDGNANSGAGLGNLAYDTAHGQIFASDLDTGMIHRISSRGKDLEQYDHGVTAREALKLDKIEFNPKNRIFIKNQKFDTNDPKSWAFTAEIRQVWGLAVHKSRLYYSVWNGNDATDGGAEIWSVDILKKGDKLKDVVQKYGGKLGEDIRKEIVVPKSERSLPISDIAFTAQGAMIIAERGQRLPSYDFKQFANTGDAAVYRYWLERPNDLETESRWIAQPEEYAVGFAKAQRNSTGGIALGYGYNSEGKMELDRCDETLWMSGENLRTTDNKSFIESLKKSGELNIQGLQASSSRPVKGSNTPPWASYFVDYDLEHENSTISGQIGDVEVFKRPCFSRYDCAGTPVVGVPGIIPMLPTVLTPNPRKPPVVIPPPNPPVVVSPPNPPQPPVGGGCKLPGGLPCFVLPICIPPLDVWPWCDKDDEKEACMVLGTSTTGPTYDSVNNEWTFPLAVTSLTSNTIDTVKITPVTPLVNLTNGPSYPVPLPNPTFTGVSIGQTAVFDVCGYDSIKAATGEPFDCCNVTFGIEIKKPIGKLDIDKKVERVFTDALVWGAPIFSRFYFVFTLTSEDGIKPNQDLSFTDTIPSGIGLSSLHPDDVANWSCPGLPITGPATLTCSYIGPKPTASNWTDELRIKPSGGEEDIDYENCVESKLVDKNTGLEIPHGGIKSDCATLNSTMPFTTGFWTKK